jgi:hypothetical protein
VYSPIYRQLTLASIYLGTPEGRAAGARIAYGDVREAWRDYLEHYNQGRGFVLIGHSQGTRMLRQLIREEVDPKPEIRRRLVSAILLGGNVLVRKGQLAGGDFRTIPACTGPTQSGCVIAFSTFNDPPPSDSRFGRAPATDTSGAGFPAGPDYEVLCTNPASLATNGRKELTTYLRGEPFTPGLISVGLVVMYGGPPPMAPTPWLRPADRYTGRCEQTAGANVLMLQGIGGARRLNPSPDATWGLHLADVNIALGELVDTVGTQAAAYGTQAMARLPQLVLALHYRPGRDPGGRRCARPPLVASVRGADRGIVRRVDFRVRGRMIRRDRSRPFRARIGSTRTHAGAVNRFSAAAVLADGRRVRLHRSVRVCG